VVQLEHATPYGTPQYALNFSSKREIYFPAEEIQFVSRQSTTYFISWPSNNGSQTGIILHPPDSRVAKYHDLELISFTPRALSGQEGLKRNMDHLFIKCLASKKNNFPPTSYSGNLTRY
jgi:hypothetical protein